MDGRAADRFEWGRECAFDAGAGEAACEAALAQVPARAGVFALFGAESNAEPYLARCANLRRRVRRMLEAGGGAGRQLNLRERTRRIAWTETGSDFEALLVLHHAADWSFGAEEARRRLRLHAPFCVRMTMENAYPRAYVTNRMSKRRLETAFGPYASRAAAERALNEALDLFLLRRCHEELRPDPSFPGCVYSEMKMCLAPCFQGCTDGRYAEEARAVLEFLATRGATMAARLEAEREAASEACEFERAAVLHSRLDNVKAAARLQDEMVRPLARLDAVIVQPAAGGGAVLFAVRGGRIAGGARFAIEGEGAVDEGLRRLIVERMDAAAAEKGEMADHLSLLRRWYYRPTKQRSGEIFFVNDKDEWPLRRILNAVERVTAGTADGGDAPARIQPESTGGNHLD